MLWNIILNNFNINDFSESEFKHLQKLYSRSLEIIEENEELFAKTKEFFKKSKINFKLKEKDYLTLYFSLLKLEEFNWTLEKLIDIYNYCATIGKLKCLYKILSILPLAIANDPLTLATPEEKLLHLISRITSKNKEIGEILKEDLMKMGFKIPKYRNTEIEITSINQLNLNEAYNLIKETIDQGNFEKALFYTVWINTNNSYKLAELLEEKSATLATILYLKSNASIDIIRDKLIKLFKIRPEKVKYALIALFQKEINSKTTIKYIWVVKSLEKIEKLAKKENALKSHYLNILKILILLNKKKKKLQKLLTKLEIAKNYTHIMDKYIKHFYSQIK